MASSGLHGFLVVGFAGWDPAFPSSDGSCTWSLVLAKCPSGDQVCSCCSFSCAQEVVIAAVMVLYPTIPNASPARPIPVTIPEAGVAKFMWQRGTLATTAPSLPGASGLSSLRNEGTR